MSRYQQYYQKNAVKLWHQVNPFYIEAGTKNLKLDYDTEYLDITPGKLTTRLLLKGLKSGTPLKIDDTTKLLEFVFDEQYFTSTGFRLQPKLMAQGFKPNHCIDTDISENIRLKYDTNDFELSPYLYQLKLINFYTVTGVSDPISKDGNDNLKFNYDTTDFGCL